MGPVVLGSSRTPPVCTKCFLPVRLLFIVQKVHQIITYFLFKIIDGWDIMEFENNCSIVSASEDP